MSCDAMIPYPPAGTIEVTSAISMFDATPLRNSEGNWSGGIEALVTGQILNSLSPINVTTGIGKLLFLVGGGTALTGTVTITGDTVDRDTGVITIGDTDTITIDGASTDNSSTGGKGGGATIHEFIDAYITNKWFTGSIAITTAISGIGGGVDLTGVDVNHVSFEQFNDQPDLVINTFDVNVFTTNTSAEFDAYLYTLHKDAGNKCHVDTEASLHIGTDGEAAIADRYWRLRCGDIDEALDGTTDGFWVDIYYLNAGNTYCQNMTMKVWFTKTEQVSYGQ
jgi:hypothetical protein